jgi:hypothetical protein
MSFDARSLDRLRQLGRSLPQPLPQPEPAPKAEAASPVGRHPVETETDPEQLFRELIKVSEDGTVPPHLLDRLRQTEQIRQRADQQRARWQSVPAASPARQGGDLRPNPKRRAPVSSEELELYSTFQQLLLEGDEDEA